MIRLVLITLNLDAESLHHFLLFTEKPFILKVRQRTISYPLLSIAQS